MPLERVEFFRVESVLLWTDKLKDKFKHMPEIKRISKHRHIPKMISSISNTKRTMSASQKRKDENERKHKNTKATSSWAQETNYHSAVLIKHSCCHIWEQKLFEYACTCSVNNMRTLIICAEKQQVEVGGMMLV